MVLPLSYRFARMLISVVVLAGLAAGGYAAWLHGFTDIVVGTGQSVAASVVEIWRSM